MEHFYCRVQRVKQHIVVAWYLQYFTSTSTSTGAETQLTDFSNASTNLFIHIIIIVSGIVCNIKNKAASVRSHLLRTKNVDRALLGLVTVLEPNQ